MQVCISEVAAGRVDRSWAGHALLFVCLYVSFHVFCFSLIRAVASLLCSCLAVFLVTLLLAPCDYDSMIFIFWKVRREFK